MDVGAWLRELGLGHYEALFRENEVEADVLPDLTEADLEKIGLPLGPRKRILKAIAKLGSPSAEAAPTHAAPDSAERRQLTVMFCDLVGSTALSARLDPEDMRRVIRAYQDAGSGVVARYDGFVAKFMGDGILAYFGFPRAHEDDAARAVHAGLELVEVVAALPAPAGEKLAARIGVATGLVVVGDIVGQGPAQEQAVVGDTPNLAARLQGLAEAGGIVISLSTRRLIGDRFRLRDLGKQALKGLPEPVEAFAALEISQSESRFEAAHASRLTGLVGREAEAAGLLARQRHAWNGRGQIVLISGEAGIGKSRIAAWLAEQVASMPHTRLRYQCSPYHRDSALYPFAQQFERAAGFSAQDGAEAKLDKLEQVLGLATDRRAAVAPLIAAMLSIPTGSRYPALNLSPAQQRRQTLFALLDQMEGLANKQPILMLFEDAHWADATSLEVLDLAIERMRKLPVLLLVTFRPEFEPPWKGLPDVADIALARLEPLQAEALVNQVTGGRKLPAEVLAQIVAKTDGVPLFVEELTKNVLESGLLIEEAESYRLDGPLPPLAIPSTLQDSLMARLDRLAAVKEIAQIGAAIGREFSYSLLQAVVGRDEATLRASLAQLEESELVFRAGEARAARYTFKHALVQDTAYESLLKSRRQILHQRVAEALRDKFPEVVEAEPELIAEHYTRAGLTEPAIVHWGKAGDLALRRSAFKEAIAHLGKAIEMAEAEQPRAGAAVVAASQRLKLQTNYGQAVMWSKGYAAEETKAALARVGKLATEVGNAETPLDAYHARFHYSLFRGELGSALKTAESFLRAAEHAARPAEEATAHRLLGTARLLRGDFPQARTHFEQTLRIYDPERDREAKFRLGPDSKAAATSYLATAAWCLGDVARARELMDEAGARAVESAHAPTLVNMYFGHAWLEILRDDAEAVLRAAQICVATSREHSLAFHLTWGALPLAWGRAKLGDRDAGSTEFREALAEYANQGNKLFLPVFQGLLAEIETEGRVADAARAGIDEALTLAGETGEHWFDAGLHRIRGEILLKQTPADPAAAESAFLTAIAVAQSQKARSFELRAALLLAKLYQSTSRPIEAHDVLAPALEGFSPTPEFPEIAEAKGLFEALAADEMVKAEAARREQRLKLQTSYGHAVMHSKGYAAEETKAAFARVGELAIDTGNPAAPLDAYFGGWVHHLTRGELGSARETAESFLRAAERAGRPTEAAVAHRCLGLTLLSQGDFAQSRAHCEQTLRIYDPARDGEAKSRLGADARVAASAYLALAAWCVGEAGRARELIDESVARAVESAHAPTLALAYSSHAVLEFLRYDAAATRQAAEACAAISQEHGLAYYLVFGAIPLAWARAKLGDQDAGTAEFRQALAEYACQSAKLRLPLFRGRLAEIESEAGDAEAALAEIDKALQLAGETGEHWYDAEFHRIHGDILLKQAPADPAPVEAAFLNAIAIAQSQKARGFELRAALSLAKLYQSTNRLVEAHDVLGPALEGFSPTPEFPEIAEATALLEALGETETVKAATMSRSHRVRLNLALGNALMQVRGYDAPETAAAFARARELAGRGETSDRYAIAYGQWMGCLMRGELPAMREHAARLLTEVAGDPESPDAAVAHRTNGITHWYAGEYVEALACFDRALTLFKPGRDSEPGARFLGDVTSTMGFRAVALWALGDADRARQSIDQMLGRLSGLSHMGSTAIGLAVAGVLEVMRGDPNRVVPHARALAKVAADHDIETMKVASQWLENWTLWRSGERDVARARMWDAYSRTDRAIGGPYMPLMAITIAEADIDAKDYDSALSGIDFILAKNENFGRLNFQAEVFRTRGEILLKQNPAAPAPAEAAFLTAIEIAQSQKARGFQLRAALALAKLYQSTNRLVEAHDVLGPALEGFSPTPEFPEIVEAKGLFEVLGRDDEVIRSADTRQRRVGLQVAYANALIGARGHGAPETLAAFERARQLSLGREFDSERFSVTYGLWLGAFVRGEVASMRELSATFLSHCADRPRSGEACAAHRVVASTHFLAGEFVEARDHLEQALALYDPERDRDLAFKFGQDLRTSALAYAPLILWPLGDVASARARAERLASLAVDDDHAATTYFGLVFLSKYEMLAGTFADERPFARSLAEYADRRDMQSWRDLARSLSSWADWREGRRESSLSEMRLGVAGQRVRGAVVWVTFEETRLAEMEAEAGEIGAALASVDRAIADAEASAPRWFLAESHRVRGEILLRQTPAESAAAEAAFLAAIGVAQSQKARSFELRAALTLAKLYQSNGRPVEAHDILGPALEGFSPTPEFPEIAEAMEAIAVIKRASASQSRSASISSQDSPNCSSASSR